MMSSQNCANSSEITASSPTTVDIDQGAPHAGVTVHTSVDPVATCSFSALLPADAATSAVGTASSAAAQGAPHAGADAAFVASVFGAAASMPAGASSTVSTFPDASAHLAVAFPVHCTCHAICTVASSVAASTAARGSLSSLTVRENGNKIHQKPFHSDSLCVCRSEKGTQQPRPDSPLRGEEKGEKPVETAATISLQQQSAYSVSLNDVRARLRIVSGRRASAEDAATGTGTVTMQQERIITFNEPTESPACLQDAIEKVIRLAAESGARRLAGRVARAAVPFARQPRAQTEERTPYHPEARHRKCPCESVAAIPTQSGVLGIQTNVLKQYCFSPELEGYDQAPEADLCTFAGQSVECASVAQPGTLCTPVGGAALCRRPQNSRVLLPVTQPGCTPAPVKEEGRCNAKGWCKRAEGKQRGLHAAEEGESPHAAAEGRCTSLVKDGTGRSRSRLPERVIKSSSMAKGRAVTHLHDKLSDKAGLTQILPQNGESAKMASFPPFIYEASANKQLLCHLTSSTRSAAVGDSSTSRLNMSQGTAMEEETAFTPLSERPLSCVRKPDARLNPYATTGRINERGDGRNEKGTREVRENAVHRCPPRTNPPPSRTADTSKLDCSSLGQQLVSMTQSEANRIRSISSPASEEATRSLAALSSFKCGNLVCSASVFPGTQGLAPTSRESAAGVGTTAAAAVYGAASGCDSATTSSEGSCPETEVEPGNSSTCVGAKRTNSAVHLKGTFGAAAHARSATVSRGRSPVMKRGNVEHYVTAAAEPIVAADGRCVSLIAPTGVHCADRIGAAAVAAVDTVWLSRAPSKARRGAVVSPSPASVAGGGTSCAPVPDLVCASAPGQAKAHNHEKERPYTPFCAARTSGSIFCSSHRRCGSTAVARAAFVKSPHMRLSATRQLYQALKADKQRKYHHCACSGAAAAAAAGALAAHKRLEEMVTPPVPSTTLQLLLQAGKATQVAWTEGRRTRQESEASATRVVIAAQTDLCTNSTAAEGQTTTKAAAVSAEPQTANYAPEECEGLAGSAEHQEGAKVGRARRDGEPVVIRRRRKEARAPVKKRTPVEVPAVRKISQQLTAAAPTAAGRVADPGRVVGDEAARQRRVVKEMQLAPEDTTAAGTEAVTKKRTATDGVAATEEDTVTNEGAAAGRIAATQEETAGDWHQQGGMTPGSTLRSQEVTANRVSAAEHGAIVQEKASSKDRVAADEATTVGRGAAEDKRQQAHHPQEVGEQGSGSRGPQEEEVGTVEGMQPREITEAKENDKHGHAEHTATRFIAVVESVSTGRSQTPSPLQKAKPANATALAKPRDFLHATDVLTEYPGGEYTSVERHERHTANVTRLAAATASSATGRPKDETEKSAFESPEAVQAATKVAAPVASASTEASKAANAAQLCDCLSLETAAESPLLPCLLPQRTGAKQVSKQRERSLHAVPESAKEQWWPYARPDALKRNFSVHAAPVNTKTEKWQQAAGSSLPHFKVKGGAPAEGTSVGAAAASARTSQPGSPRAACFVARKAATAELTASALSADALAAFGATALVGTQCRAATTLPESPAARATAVPLAVSLPFVRRCPRVADSTVAAFAKAASLAACAAAESCCQAAVPASPQAAPGASAVVQICAAAAARVRPSASADDVEVAPSVSIKSAPPAAAAVGYLTQQEAGEARLSPQSMVCYSCSSNADRPLQRSSGPSRYLAPFSYKSAPSVSLRPCLHRLPSTAARNEGRIFPGSPIGRASLNICISAAVAAPRSPTPATSAGGWPRSAAGPSNAEAVDVALDTSPPPAAANDASGAAKRDAAAHTAAAATTAATHTAAAALAEELAQRVETRRGSVESLCFFPPATAVSSPAAARVAECGGSCAVKENCYVEQRPIQRTPPARPTDSNIAHHSSTTRSSSSNSRANQGNSSISSNVVDRARTDSSSSSSSEAICRKNDFSGRVMELCCASPTASALSVDVEKAKADENTSHPEAEEEAGSYSRLNLTTTSLGYTGSRYYHCRLSCHRQIDGLTTQARPKHADVNTDQDSPVFDTCRVPVSGQNSQQQLPFPLQQRPTLQQQHRPAMQQGQHQGFQQQLQQHHGQQVHEVRQQSQQPRLQQEPQERTTVQELPCGHPTHSTRQQLEHRKLIQQHIPRLLEQQQRLAHVAHQQQRQQVPLNLQQLEGVHETQQQQKEQRLQQQRTPTGHGCYAQNWQVEQFRRLATQQSTPQRKQSANPREKEQHEQQEKQHVCSRFSEQPSGRISAAPVEYERATPMTRESASALPTRSQLQQKQQQQVRPIQQWEYTRQARHTQEVEKQRESPGSQVQLQGQQWQLWEQHLREQYQKWQASQGCQLTPELCVQKQQPHGPVSEAQLDCCRNAGPAPSNIVVREFPKDFELQRTVDSGCNYSNRNDRRVSSSSSSSRSCSTSCSCGSGNSGCSDSGRRCNRRGPALSAHSGHDLRLPYVQAPVTEAYGEEAKQARSAASAQPHSYKEIQHSGRADCTAALNAASISADAAVTSVETATVVRRGGMFGAGAATGNRAVVAGAAAAAAVVRPEAAAASVMLGNTVRAGAGPAEKCAASPSAVSSASSGPDRTAVADPPGVCYVPLLPSFLSSENAGASETCRAAPDVAEAAERGGTVHRDCTSTSVDPVLQKQHLSLPGAAAGSTCWPSHVTEGSHRDQQDGGTLPVWCSPAATGDAAAAAAHKGGAGTAVTAWPKKEQRAGAVVAVERARPTCQAVAAVESAFCCIGRGSETESAAVCPQETAETVAAAAADASHRHSGEAPAAGTTMCCILSAGGFCRSSPLQHGRRSSSLSSALTPQELHRAAYQSTRRRGKRSSSCCSKIGGGSSNLSAVPARAGRTSRLAADGGTAGALGAAPAAGAGQCTTAPSRERSAAAANASEAAVGGMLSQRQALRAATTQGSDHLWEAEEHLPQQQVSSTESRGSPKHCVQPQLSRPLLLLQQLHQQQPHPQQPQQPRQQQLLRQWQPAFGNPLSERHTRQHLPDSDGSVAPPKLSWRHRVSLSLQRPQPQLEQSPFVGEMQQQKQQPRQLCKQLRVPLPQTTNNLQLQHQHTRDQELLFIQLQQQRALLAQQSPQRHQTILPPSMHMQPARLLLQQRQRQTSDLLQKAQLTQKLAQPQTGTCVQQEPLVGELLQQPRRLRSLQQQMLEGQQGRPAAVEHRMQRRSRSEPHASVWPLEKQQDIISYPSVAAAAVSRVPGGTAAAHAASFCTGAPSGSLALLVNSAAEYTAAVADGNWRESRFAGGCFRSGVPALASSAVATRSVSVDDDVLLQQHSPSAVAAATAIQTHMGWEARVEAAKQRTRDSLRHMLERDKKSFVITTSAFTKRQSLSRCCCCCAHCCHRWKSLTIKQRQRYRAAAIWLLTGVLLALCAVAMVCIVVMKMLLHQEVQV